MPHSFPAIVAALLFWALACYVLSRGGFSADSLLAVGWQFSIAVFFLGEALKMHSTSAEQWVHGVRLLRWSPVLSQVLFFWLCIQLLHDLRLPEGERFLRRVGVPLAVGATLLGAFFTAAIYLTNQAFRWDLVHSVPAAVAGYEGYAVPTGPAYLGQVALRLLTGLGALVITAISWRGAVQADERYHFGRIMLGQVLGLTGSSLLVAANFFGWDWWPDWLSHLVILAGIGVIAVHVASYSQLVRGRLIGRDMAYFASLAALISLLFAAVFLLAADLPARSMLELLFSVLLLAILLHACADYLRIPQRVVSYSSLESRLPEPVATLAELRHMPSPWGDAPCSNGHSKKEGPDAWPLVGFVGLNEVAHPWRYEVERALKTLHQGSSLGGSRLLAWLSFSVDAALAGYGITPAAASSLERAGALREQLLAAIERTRPRDGGPDSPAAQEYRVLHGAFVKRHQHQWVMTELGISARTFYRVRNRALDAIADDLELQESRLVHGTKVRVPATQS